MFLANLFKRNSLIETILIVFLYLGIGFWINPHDPCLFQSNVPFLIIILAVITLFHGLNNGLLAIFIIALAMKFFYPVFNINLFLTQLMLVLIFGQFYIYWNKKIFEQEHKLDFLTKKLDELSVSFYALKISHDQLEKSYVSKPISIRNSILLIKQEYNENAAKAYHSFCTVLQKNFTVQKAVLCHLENDKTINLIETINDAVLDREDLLLKKSLLRQQSLYISEDPTVKSRYIAVLPVILEDKVTDVLCIESMPFLSFNKDTLTTISILLDYFFSEIYAMDMIKQNSIDLHIENDNFRLEYIRLYWLYKKFTISSSILVVRTSQSLMNHRVGEEIERNLRALDISVSTQYPNGYCMIVLFPMSDYATAEGFWKRVEEKIDIDSHNAYVYSIFYIDQIDDLNHFIEGEG